LVQHTVPAKCHYDLGGDWNHQAATSGDQLAVSNDESSNAAELVEEVVRELERAAQSNPARLTWFKTLGEAISAAKSDQTYICCFCERDNLLSQWRGYADNGGGVSFEFDPVGFTEITGRDCPHGLMRLWKVFYNRDQQRQILRKCIDYPYWPSQADGIRFVVDALQFFMPTFKNPDFREQGGVNLPPCANMAVRWFRARGGLLVVSFSLPASLVWRHSLPPADIKRARGRVCET
jgi:hypothetical protein